MLTHHLKIEQLTGPKFLFHHILGKYTPLLTKENGEIKIWGTGVKSYGQT